MVLAEGHKHTMALDQSALLEGLEALKAAEVDDRIRQAAETIYQALIEAELTDSRTAWRNGHRPRTVITTAGDLELRIPKLRAGSFFPSLLERRRRAGQSLFAVIMEAYLHGTSTRKVDDLVKALGADSGSPSPRCPGSVQTWIPRWPHSATAAWPGSHLGMCSWTPLTARPGSITG
jgi:mutator family transposase